MPKDDPRPSEIWWHGEDEKKRYVIQMAFGQTVVYGIATLQTNTTPFRYVLSDDTPRMTTNREVFLKEFEPPCSFNPDAYFPYKEGTCDTCGNKDVELDYYTYVKHDDGTHTNFWICQHCYSTVPCGLLGGMIKEQIRLREEGRERPTVWDRLSD